MKCTTLKRDGSQCRANAKGTSGRCRWHSQTPEDRAAHFEQSRAGGEAKALLYGSKLPTTDALDTNQDIAALDFSTAAGLKALLAETLRGMTRLPLDTRLATAIQQVAGMQRTLIVESDHEARLAALEAARAVAA